MKAKSKQQNGGLFRTWSDPVQSSPPRAASDSESDGGYHSDGKDSLALTADGSYRQKVREEERRVMAEYSMEDYWSQEEGLTELDKAHVTDMTTPSARQRSGHSGASGSVGTNNSSVLSIFANSYDGILRRLRLFTPETRKDSSSPNGTDKTRSPGQHTTDGYEASLYDDEEFSFSPPQEMRTPPATIVVNSDHSNDGSKKWAFGCCCRQIQTRLQSVRPERVVTVLAALLFIAIGVALGAWAAAEKSKGDASSSASQDNSVSAPRPLPPSASAINFPTVSPTVETTLAPTLRPVSPTAAPVEAVVTTAAPTEKPTSAPTGRPTAAPTSGPTSQPTAFPTYVKGAECTGQDSDAVFFVSNSFGLQDCVFLRENPVQRARLCLPGEDAYRLCPNTCCVSRTDAPTPAPSTKTPTDAPTNSPTDFPTPWTDLECTGTDMDAEFFISDEFGIQNCEFLLGYPDERTRVCEPGQAGYDFCPQTCCRQFEPTEPTATPTTMAIEETDAPVEEPTPSPTDSCGEESPDAEVFISDIAGFQTCDWLSREEGSKRRVCNEGFEAYEICRRTCGNCSPTAEDESPPTESPVAVGDDEEPDDDNEDEQQDEEGPTASPVEQENESPTDSPVELNEGEEDLGQDEDDADGESPTESPVELNEGEEDLGQGEDDADGEPPTESPVELDENQEDLEQEDGEEPDEEIEQDPDEEPQDDGEQEDEEQQDEEPQDEDERPDEEEQIEEEETLTARSIILNASPDSLSDLEDEDSAQARALEWIESGDYESMQDGHVMQSWVMASFAFQTDIDDWDLDFDWLDEVGNECEWFGVVCDEEDRVVFIDLGRNNLRGELLPELSLLSDSLEELDLSRNRIRGRIPRSFGRLRNLVRLQLERNDLSGRLPSQIGRLESLSVLKLEFNDLDGELPDELEDLTNLEEFTFFSNDFFGEVPEGMCDLENLDTFENDCRKVDCDCCSRCWFECGGNTGIPCN